MDIRVSQLLTKLHKNGVRVWEDNGQIAISAQSDLNTLPLVEELKANKALLLGYLKYEKIHSETAFLHLSDKGLAELSFGQSSILFVDRFEEQSGTLHIPYLIALSESADIKRLNDALHLSVARHDVLTTVYGTDERGVDYQRIEKCFKGIENKTLDDDSLLAQLRSDISAPFDLERESSIRAICYTCSDRQYLLLVCHHIGFDGWSFKILMNTLSEAYQQLESTIQPILQKAPFTFRDYARWQREYLQGDVLNQLQLYWGEQLAGMVMLNLPSDKMRTAKKDFTGKNCSRELDEDLSSGLRQLASDNRTTLFSVMLSGYFATLSVLCNQNDIVIGSPFDNRELPHSQDLVGFLANILPLRQIVNRKGTVKELIAQVHEMVIDAKVHQALPLDQIVAVVGKEHRSRASLFQATFGLEHRSPNNQHHNLPFIDTDSSLLQQSYCRAQYELSLTCYDGANRIPLIVNYQSGLYSEPFVCRFLDMYTRILSGFVQNDQQAVRSLQLLSASEQAELIRDLSWNGKPVERCTQTIDGAFSEQVSASPEKVALFHENMSLTYRELQQRVDSLSSKIKQYLVTDSTGAIDNRLVPLFLQKNIDMVVSILAVLKAGGAYVPIALDGAVGRSQTILKEINAPLILTNGNAFNTLKAWCIDMAIDSKVINIDNNIVHENKEKEELPSHDANDLAYVMYTSGTTGTPKGVMINHASVVQFARADHNLERRSFDKVAGLANYSFDAFVIDLFHTLLNGKTLYLFDVKETASQDELAAQLIKHEIDTCFLTTSLFNHWVESGLLQKTQIKNVMFGGEKASEKAVGALLSARPDIRLLNCYGPTEVTVMASVHTCCIEDTCDRIPIGRAIDGKHIYLLDQDMNVVPRGSVGEIYVGGFGLAQGYFKQDIQTEKVFVENEFAKLKQTQYKSEKLYKTGDLGMYLANGNLVFAGRTDDQLKIRGYRVEIGEVCAALERHPDISNAAVIASQTESLESVLVAYYTSSGDTLLSVSSIQRFLLGELPDYMLPGIFHQLEVLPLKSNGKLDTSALPQVLNVPVDLQLPESPFGGKESLMATIWQDLLNLPHIGRHQDFFKVGGHSIKAMQLQDQIRKFFAVELPLPLIFKCPTIAQLVSEINAIAEKAKPTVSKIVRKSECEISLAQERMWLLDKMQSGSGISYNVPLLIKFNGRLDQKALHVALEILIQRHETLRSRFVSTEHGPRVIIDECVSLVMQKTKFDSYQHLYEDALKIASTQFDLSDGKLFRLRIAMLSSEINYLQVTFHHIIVDGWSISIFLNELAETYNSLVKGEPVAFDELDIQYVDFAAFQRKMLNDAQIQDDMAYWKKKLANLQSSLNMPIDRVRPAVKSFNGSICQFSLPDTLLRQLKQLSNEQNVTLYMTLLAAFKVLLKKYSHQDDIAVGSAAANRNYQGTQELIGLFVNTLVLRSLVSDETSFVGLLNDVKDTVLGAYQHQEIPLEYLIQELRLERSLSFDPLFQVMFNFHTLPEITNNWHEISAELVELNIGTAKFDLNVSLTEKKNRLFGKLEYNSDLFDQKTIERFIAHYENLLGEIVRNRYQNVADISILSDSERHLLLHSWNDTAYEYAQNTCIHELFERQVECSPHATAISTVNEIYTYQQINYAANALAKTLIDKGIKPNRLVGVLMPKSAELIVVLLAILKAGGGYVPIDINHPKDRVNVIIQDSGVELVIVEPKFAVKLPEGVSCMHASYEWLVNPVRPFENISRSSISLCADDLAYVIYTSGSTGKPKGVAVQHRAVINVIEWVNRSLEVNPKDKLLFITSISFDLSVYDIFGIFAAGASIHLESEDVLEEPARLVNVMVNEAITIWDSAPASLNRLTPYFEAIDQQNHTCTLRLVMLSGDWIPVHLPDKIRDTFQGAKVVSLGGATEATIWSNYYFIENVDQDWASIPYGKPIQNAQYYVLDKFRALCPIGVPGDLFISGDCLAKEYYNDPQKTAEKYVEHFHLKGQKMYATGDMARWMPDGNLQFLGRVDGQVKIRGFRIELGEIEKFISDLPGVRDAIVLAQTDGSGEKHLCAYIVEKSPVSLSEIKHRMREVLPEYMVPAFMTVIKSFPVTANGKLDRKQLPSLDELRESMVSKDTREKSELECSVATIVQQTLAVEHIGLNDNWFDLGATSLSLTKINSALNEAFNTEIDLIVLFQYPTIEAISKRFGGEKLIKPVEEVDQDEDFELLQSSINLFD